MQEIIGDFQSFCFEDSLTFSFPEIYVLYLVIGRTQNMTDPLSNENK